MQMPLELTEKTRLFLVSFALIPVLSWKGSKELRYLEIGKTEEVEAKS